MSAAYELKGGVLLPWQVLLLRNANIYLRVNRHIFTQGILLLQGIRCDNNIGLVGP